MRRDACTLGAERVFDDLYDHLATFTHQVGDLARSIRLSGLDIGSMQKGCTFQPGIDEGRLHTRQHPADLAPVDLAYQATTLGTLNINFLQDAILDQRYPGFPGRDIYQYLFAHASLWANSALLANTDFRYL